MENKREPLYVWVEDDAEGDMFHNLPFINYITDKTICSSSFLGIAEDLLNEVRTHNRRIVYDVPGDYKDTIGHRVPTRAEILLLETWMLSGKPSYRNYFALREKLYGSVPQTFGQTLFELRDLLIQ